VKINVAVVCRDDDEFKELRSDGFFKSTDIVNYINVSSISACGLYRISGLEGLRITFSSNFIENPNLVNIVQYVKTRMRLAEWEIEAVNTVNAARMQAKQDSENIRNNAWRDLAVKRCLSDIADIAEKKKKASPWFKLKKLLGR